MEVLMRLLQFTDSALPVGTFSFSNGLETAVHEGIVHDADTLQRYVGTMVRQAALSDGVAALHAHRAACRRDMEALVLTDAALLRSKMNEESRLMLRRMGRKLAELALAVLPHEWLADWIEAVKLGDSPGCYPVAQGVVFALAGMDEEQLFASHQYGVAGMMLGAALRCIKVSHYDTQAILYRQAAATRDLYEEVRHYALDEMQAFMPQADILASLHEKGRMRMFMN
ncbi:MAG: urease accessory protein UreF [Bacteroides sp.]|nr:urease accessory protein UreF [Bacteroides sp.]